MDMNRQLKVVVEALTAKTVTSQEPAERRTDSLIYPSPASRPRLSRPGNQLARRVLWASRALVVLTVALVRCP
jgi:hypothetical protein